MVEAYAHWVDRPIWYKVIEWTFAALFAIDYAVHLWAAPSRSSFFFSPFSIVDLVTIFPVFFDIFASNDNDGFSVFKLIRVLRSLRILRAYRLVLFTTRSVGKELAVLLFALVSLLFCSTAVIHAWEERALSDEHCFWVNKTYDYDTLFGDEACFGLHDAFYLIVISLSTVGYGDMSPVTGGGRATMILLIAGSVVLVGYLSSRLVSILAEQTYYSKKYKPGPGYFAVICGDYTATDFAEFCTEFFHPDHERFDIRLVLLSRDLKPSEQLKRVIDDPTFDGRISFLSGTVFSSQDLGRLAISKADAVFILASQRFEDRRRGVAEANILRAVALRQANPNLNLFVEVRHSRSIQHLHANHFGDVFCLSVIKRKMLGLSLRCPGSLALISNLTHSFDYTVSDSEWTREYSAGLSQELYVVALPASFGGLRFKTVATMLFMRFAVTLLGVITKEDGRLAVNPSHYVISGGELCYMIATDAHQASSVETYQLGAHFDTEYGFAVLRDKAQSGFFRVEYENHDLPVSTDDDDRDDHGFGLGGGWSRAGVESDSLSVSDGDQARSGRRRQRARSSGTAKGRRGGQSRTRGRQGAKGKPRRTGRSGKGKAKGRRQGSSASVSVSSSFTDMVATTASGGGSRGSRGGKVVLGSRPAAPNDADHPLHPAATRLRRVERVGSREANIVSDPPVLRRPPPPRRRKVEANLDRLDTGSPPAADRSVALESSSYSRSSEGSAYSLAELMSASSSSSSSGPLGPSGPSGASPAAAGAGGGVNNALEAVRDKYAHLASPSPRNSADDKGRRARSAPFSPVPRHVARGFGSMRSPDPSSRMRTSPFPDVEPGSVSEGNELSYTDVVLSDVDEMSSASFAQFHVHIRSLAASPSLEEALETGVPPDLGRAYVIVGGLEQIHLVVSPLRADFLPVCTPVILFSPSVPTQEQWEKVCRFNRIYLYVGSALKARDIHAVFYEDIKYMGVLILNSSSEAGTGGGEASGTDDLGTDYLVDADPLLSMMQIESRLMHTQGGCHVVTELIHSSNTKFVNPVPTHAHRNHVLLPAFAAGRAYSTSVLNAIIPQAYFNPSLVGILSVLIEGSEEAEESSYLFTRPVDGAFVGKEYARYFVFCTLMKNFLPLGLYRAPRGNCPTPYAFTNPSGDTIIEPGDRVFVLAASMPAMGHSESAEL